MSVEQITTNVVRCNGRGCEESYAELVSGTTYRDITKMAVRDGWEQTESTAFHFCPDCSKKRRAKRTARDIQNGIIRSL